MDLRLQRTISKMILNTRITFYTARVSQNDVFVVDDDKIKISINCEKRRK